MTNISQETFLKIKKGDTVEVHTTCSHYEFIATGKPTPIRRILKGTKTKIYKSSFLDQIGNEVNRRGWIGIVSVRSPLQNYSIRSKNKKRIFTTIRKI